MKNQVRATINDCRRVDIGNITYRKIENFMEITPKIGFIIFGIGIITY